MVQDILEMIDIRVSGDESLLGTCTEAYIVIRQPSGTKQGSIASKSRYPKKQLKIPRLESVEAHMVANLADNIWNSLRNSNIREVYIQSGSTVVLCWLPGDRAYRQFVHNRVIYINSNMPITWSCVNIIQNPADNVSRWSNIKNVSLFSLLTQTKKNCTNKGIWKNAKVIREAMCIVIEKMEEIYQLLRNFEYWKVIRITSWIKQIK